jgi:hypothetical protein
MAAINIVILVVLYLLAISCKAIDAKLEWFATEVRRRYKIIETHPNPTFQPLTLCCDESTNWAGRCSAAGEFFQSALSDISAKLKCLA